MHSGWLLLGFILAYVGPFRRYVGAKKFALKSKIFWCEKVGVGIAHVWPMLGHVETMLGLCLACLGPFWGQLGPCWGMLGLRWVIWGFNGVKNYHQPSIGSVGVCFGPMLSMLGVMLGQNGVFVWVVMLQSKWTRQLGPCWGYVGSMLATQFFWETRMRRKTLNIIWYIIKNNVSTFVPLWFFENYIYGWLICSSRGRP